MNKYQFLYLIILFTSFFIERVDAQSVNTIILSSKNFFDENKFQIKSLVIEKFVEAMYSNGDISKKSYEALIENKKFITFDGDSYDYRSDSTKFDSIIYPEYLSNLIYSSDAFLNSFILTINDINEDINIDSNSGIVDVGYTDNNLIKYIIKQEDLGVVHSQFKYLQYNNYRVLNNIIIDVNEGSNVLEININYNFDLSNICANSIIINFKSGSIKQDFLYTLKSKML